MLSISQGMLVGGDLATKAFVEGDQPYFTIRFDDLTPDSHTATITIDNGPAIPMLVDEALNTPSTVFVENYLDNGIGQIHWEQDGNYPVEINVYGSAGNLVGSYLRTIDVANSAPELLLKAPTSLADTLNPFELHFDITDLGNDLAQSITIDWGDGNQDSITDLGPGSTTHQYDAPGSYTILANVTDNDGPHPWQAFETPIHVAPPNSQPATTELQLNPEVVFVNGERFAGTVAWLSNYQLALSDYSATIHWADGHSSIGHIVAHPDGTASINSAHTHRNFGDREFRVQVTSPGEAPVTETVPIRVCRQVTSWVWLSTSSLVGYWLHSFP